MDYRDVEFEMPGFPPLLWQRLQKTLPLCGVFSSDAALRGVFLDARLKPWQAGLPEETNTAARIAAVINYLYGRFNKYGDNGLFLLVQVLRDSTHPDDDLNGKLESLALELEQLQAAARLAAQQKAAAQHARDLAKLAANHPAQRAAALSAAQEWVDIAPDDGAACALLDDLMAQEEARRKMQEEAAHQAQEEADRKAKAEADRKAKEEAERKAKAEADRKAKEEADRKAKEEADRKAKEEAERKAKAEAARKAREEADRKAQAEAAAKALRLTELCAQMRAAADRQDWPDVARRAEQILGLQPGDANATQWVAYAREQMRRVVVPPPPVITPSPVTTQPSPVKAAPTTIARLPFEPELILIPAGEFLMGSDKQKDPQAYDNELPQHTLYLPDYYIAKTSTTNAQYAAFVEATGYKAPSHWKGPGFLKKGKPQPPQGKENHPVVNVSWNDALAYCKWLAEVTGKPYTLPSEAEWEKAARGTDGRIYPWGNTSPNDRLCNFSSNVKDTTPVGKYSLAGDSPYGCVDMAGNVWDWTRSLYQPYPYDLKGGRENLQADGNRVVRGGSWYVSANYLRSTFRNWYTPTNTLVYQGFRCGVARAQD